MEILFMRLNRSSLKNRIGKAVAGPLSLIASARWIYPLTRMADAYLNFLMGKGSGTGWNLRGEVCAAARCIHRQRPVVFDVGANVGDWTQGLLKIIPDAKVYMFDPSPGCQEAILKKRLTGVTLMPFALGETCGQSSYFSSSMTDGSASLHERRDTPFENLNYERTTVTVRTLDDVIESERIEFVDFIKMDIEGHEFFALKGAERSLAAGKIGALSFEFGCGNINSRTFFRDFWELLSAANFILYRITPGGKNVPVKDYY